MLKTLFLTTFAIAGALFLMSGAWLITGRIWKRTSCGDNPEKKRGDSCSPKGCGMCQNSDVDREQ